MENPSPTCGNQDNVCVGVFGVGSSQFSFTSVCICLMAVIPLLYDLQNCLTQYIVMPDKHELRNST